MFWPVILVFGETKCMTPRLRKFALTMHITFSVGWLGGVAGFLVLAIAGLTSHDAEMVRGVYLAMDLIYRFVIVPIGLAALVTGLVQALGTQWGLFRHYWILVKFLLTIGACILMLVHIIAVLEAANRVSAAGVLPGAELGPLATQRVADSGLALLVLLTTTTLAVYKPWGMTRHGQRKQLDDTGVRPDRGSTVSTPWGPYVLLGIFGLALLFVGLHLTGRGLGGH